MDQDKDTNDTDDEPGRRRRANEAARRGADHLGRSMCGTCRGQRRVVDPGTGDPVRCPACDGEGIR